MTVEELQKIYLAKPFKIRNADEYDLENILDLFIDPTDGLTGPFDFSNSIIKGKMGSGKTMYLRANYAYYLYTLVPSLIDGEALILPVYIKLSDFQNIQSPEKIYYAILIKIIDEIVGVCNHLQSAEELARLHAGVSNLAGIWDSEGAYLKIAEKLKTLTATEYVEKVSSSFGVKGSTTAKFLSLYKGYEKKVVNEIKRNTTPSFQDVIDTCAQLITPFDGKLLLLFDEVGSINKRFFKDSHNGTSYFETMMNQLRTLSYVRTKIAVYPHSDSDILTETRYGDAIELECDFESNNLLYTSFIEKTVSLIERYVQKVSATSIKAEDVFEISVNDQQIIIQLINASHGNMRRLVHLLDMSMDAVFARCQGREKVTIGDMIRSLKKQGEMMEHKYSNQEQVFLSQIAMLCKKRSTYKFNYPNKSATLTKFTSLSEEYNVISIQQVGSGRKGNIYAFDYAYCVYKDIPTHYVKDSEKIDKTRNSIQGEPITRVAQLSDDLLVQSNIRGKIEGVVEFWKDESYGMVKSDAGESYLVRKDFVIKSDRKKNIHIGSKLSFLVSEVNGILLASEVEVLE